MNRRRISFVTTKSVSIVLTYFSWKRIFLFVSRTEAFDRTDWTNSKYTCGFILPRTSKLAIFLPSQPLLSQQQPQQQQQQQQQRHWLESIFPHPSQSLLRSSLHRRVSNSISMTAYSTTTTTTTTMTMSSSNIVSSTEESPPIAAASASVGEKQGMDPPITAAPKGSFAVTTTDSLFRCIEEQHGSKAWGDVLDAGTGIHSIRWLVSAMKNSATSITAITADKAMQISVQKEVNRLLRRSKRSSSFDTDDDSTSNEINDEFPENPVTLDIENCHVLIGNWFPNSNNNNNDNNNSRDRNISPIGVTQNGSSKSVDTQLNGKKYDVIVADYLIGAMDGFSPYQQDLMIPKLLEYLKNDGGRLYVIGLQPLPDKIEGSDDNNNNNNNNSDANIICRVRQVRDACILLAGHRCYREYPVEWVLRQFDKFHPVVPNPQKKMLLNKLIETMAMTADTNNTSSSSSSTVDYYYSNPCNNNNDDGNNTVVTVTHVQRFPIIYRYETVVKQINVGRSKIPYFANQVLANAMEQELNDLDKQCQAVFQRNPRISLGFDYVVCAEKSIQFSR